MASITGSASGVRSISPAQIASTRASSKAGTTAEKRSTVARMLDAVGCTAGRGDWVMSPFQGSSPLVTRHRPSASCRPAQSAFATPITCSSTVAQGAERTSVTIGTSSGTFRPSGSSNSLPKMPAASTTRPAGITSLSVRTPLTRPPCVSMATTRSPKRSVAPARSAARTKLSTVACGSALPSLVQREAATT